MSEQTHITLPALERRLAEARVLRSRLATLRARHDSSAATPTVLDAI